MRQQKTEGIIIKRNNYSEADRLLTIFTKRLGKIRVKAAGVRKLTSRRSPHIELLNLSVVSLYQGKGMPVLTEVTCVDNFSGIKEDLSKVGFAYHVCELIDGLCAENEENEVIFELLHETLTRLGSKENIVSVINEFEIELLTILGFYRQSNTSSAIDTTSYIEQILEKKLKTKRILHKFS